MTVLWCAINSLLTHYNVYNLNDSFFISFQYFEWSFQYFEWSFGGGGGGGAGVVVVGGGIQQSPMDSPHIGTVIRSFDISIVDILMLV